MLIKNTESLIRVDTKNVSTLEFYYQKNLRRKLNRRLLVFYSY